MKLFWIKSSVYFLIPETSLSLHSFRLFVILSLKCWINKCNSKINQIIGVFFLFIFVICSFPNSSHQLSGNLCLSSIPQNIIVLDRGIKISVIGQYSCSCCLQSPALTINVPKFFILILAVNCHDWITYWLKPIKIIYMHILNYLFRDSYCSNEKYSFLFCYRPLIQIFNFSEKIPV